MIQISESEKLVMDILWGKSPLTANEIIARLAVVQDWQDKTIKTLLNRLLKKEAIKFDKAGREYHYSPILQQQDYVNDASSKFINRIFGGNISSLIVAFVKQEKLSKNDIKDLKSLLSQLEKQAENHQESSK